MLSIQHNLTSRKCICLRAYRWYNNGVALTSGDIFDGRRWNLW